MKIKLPLYAKIVFWFFLNMIILGAVFLTVALGELHFGLDSLVSGPAGARLQTAVQEINDELRDRPRAEWTGILKNYNDAYHLKFYLFQDGVEAGGEPVDPPPQVRERLEGRRDSNRPSGRPEEDFPGGRPPPGGGLEEPGPPGGGRLQPGAQGRPPLRELVHTSSPGRYWLVSRIVLPGPDFSRPRPMFLLIESGNISGNGLFFDLKPWIYGGVAVIVISVLFWLPLVRGITRALSQMTRATERIAEGNFEVRTQVARRDELGSLSDAINRMALRLSGFVSGQKRFLGDIAHELCSPIARIQVALGILEQRADEKQKTYLADLREEVEQMSGLVNELLSFSKASLGAKTIQLRAVPLRAVVEKAIVRETAGEGLEVKLEVQADLQVMAEPELLLRAVSNVLRNSVRYAGNAGPIKITARVEAERVQLMIEDCGPGIPAESLPQIFDPFYRVDVSRDRETGGVGLGLSIVKTCVESCGGTVECENIQPHGLRMNINLTPAPEEITKAEK